MKRLFHFNSILITSAMAFIGNTGIISAQTDKKQPIVIPQEINAIFENSCMSCHGVNGGRYPKSRLNFTRWEAYGVSKEVEKASLICSRLKKGAMPPESARESHPELIPTKEQVDLICKWSESLKSVKPKK